MPVPFVAHFLNKETKSDFGQKLVGRVLKVKSKMILERMRKYIKGDNILDIGTGIGGIHKHLLEEGYKVTGLDVHNVSGFSEIKPVIYDGQNFPFGDEEFDTGVIVHVLHHCSDGVKVLDEAMRTCKRVVLMEDTYRNWLEHKIVSFNDNLGNWEWYQHPYHKTDWWLRLFKKRGWKVLHCEEYVEFTYRVLYGRYAFFVLEKLMS